MIDTDALRKKVIELAIKGKLTEQLPEDGDAESLYVQIQEEKAKLINEGKIRKDKDLQPVLDEEIPFDKPANWLFVRFSSIITLQSGQDLNATDYNAEGNGIPYITGASNYRDDGTLIINRWTDVPKAFAYRGDILLSCKGTVGKLTILDQEEVHIARQIMGIRTYSVNVRFVRYFVDWMLEVIKSASKGLIPGIERNDILNLCCPLPPLSEQARIVDKIEGILAQIDTIDTLQQQYASDLSVLKGKIIDAGIRGKLTEQLPEDGDAETLYSQIQEEKAKLIKEGKIKKEKPLPEIDDDEIPFEIPKNWKWFRLNSIVNKITDGTHHSPENTSQGDYMYVTAKNIKDEGVVLDNITYVSAAIHKEIYSRCNPEKNDILLVKDGATTGVVTINNIEEPFSMLSSVALIKPSIFVEPWYIAYIMRSSWFSKYIKGEMTGVGITRVVLKQIESFIIPLPPLVEQKRIASIINELLQIIG